MITIEELIKELSKFPPTTHVGTADFFNNIIDGAPEINRHLSYHPSENIIYIGHCIDDDR